jgi:hypothetical protein
MNEGEIKWHPRFADYGADEFGGIWSRKHRRRFHSKAPLVRLSCAVSWGYFRVSLALGKTRMAANVRVGRFVLECFVGPCPPGHVCCHKDGNKKNDRPDNLYWGTSHQNEADKLLHGTRLFGSRHPRAKLKELDIPVIRALSAQGVSNPDIAARFGVDRGTIRFVLNGGTWSHVP